ncbi:MAG: hypothetical protein RLZZ605_839 [Bacteroidota bacterium]|jgi:hypothetical protein
MIAENFRLLIEKLKYKSAKREAIWAKTSRDEEFKLHLGKVTLLTDCWYDEVTFNKKVDLVILNEDGEKIDGVILSKGEDDYELLIELHTLAKQSYYKIDETFKSIFEELDSNKVIGEKNKHELDDLI